MRCRNRNDSPVNSRMCARCVKRSSKAAVIQDDEVLLERGIQQARQAMLILRLDQVVDQARRRVETYALTLPAGGQHQTDRDVRFSPAIQMPPSE